MTAPPRIEVDLPYFERLIALMGSSVDERADRHDVHWGFFDEEHVEESWSVYPAAAAAMTQLVCDRAGVSDGSLVADIGCGFGGTLQHLNDRLRSSRFVGVNIDRRQLKLASELIHIDNGNHVELVEADACAMPLRSGAFDIVLAVECVFHFPSRRGFLEEAARLLGPSGRLTLSDFVVDSAGHRKAPDLLASGTPALAGFFGRSPAGFVTMSQYVLLARLAGLSLVQTEDITTRTMPTYPALKRKCRDHGWHDGEAALDVLEQLAAAGVLRYALLTCERADC